jgi:nitrite reductase (NO-forming)/hydroxylamine reductase
MDPIQTPSSVGTKEYSRRDGFIALLITAVVVVAGVSVTSYKKQGASVDAEGNKIYTATELAVHNKVDDCWIVIDGLVFDMTEPSKSHPGSFHCGGDGSENYHKNHGPTIRSRMDPFRIGKLNLASAIQLTSKITATTTAETITPTRELFAEEGSWDPLNLMIVMERDNKSLLAIDGSTHKAVGRVKDIGKQVHTQVFSPDGKFTYHISRDGGLTKIDLRTLKPEGIVRVGSDSRGTAITDSGKYVAIGNYEPRQVVIIDAETLAIIIKIELLDTRDGTVTHSRAGAVVENGEKFVVSLKDGRSVWVIDTTKRGMPVSNYFWDIGKKGDVLHDGYLTPDGRYYITAVQGSDVAWVLDTKNMKPVAEVKTGKTPHTGPGATWGNYTFVHALAEGVLTAIDMRTWAPAAYIKVGGAGLFTRSFYKDPTYPYIWADTAFGEQQDEIDVIDGATLKIVKKLFPMKGERAVHPEFTRDGKYVYVAVWTGNKVFVYDSKTFEVVTTIDAFTPTGISSVAIRVEEPGL